MAATVFAPSLQLLWELIEARGRDPEGLFRRYGVEPQTLRDANARLSVRQARTMYRAAFEEIGDPALGVEAGNYWHPTFFHALGYAWLTSATLRTAIGRLSRYVGIVSEAVEIESAPVAGGLRVVLRYHDPEPIGIAREDAALSILVRLCRMNAGPEWDPVSVSFMHHPPRDVTVYRRYFRCPLEFSADASSMTAPADSVDAPLPGNNAQLAQIHDQVVIGYFARLGRERIEHRVEAEIIKRLPSGPVTDDDVAAALAMSTRSLQRRLQSEGTTFKDVLDATRRELAESYINDPALSLTEISFLLGFSEPSAFSRAFRRWNGVAPSGYRARP